MISVKDSSVIVSGLNPEIVLGIIIVSGVFKSWELPVVITEGVATTGHGKASLHYIGNAVDIRSKHISTDKQDIIDECLKVLGMDYDMILENEGMPNEHFHLEFQPKRR